MDQGTARVLPDHDQNPSQSETGVSPKGGAATLGRPARSEPQEVLPTDRVSFEKQTQFLLAYAAASEKGNKGVSNDSVAGLVNMKASTVSLANVFFMKCGFLTRSGREYLPAKEVLEYHLARGWNDDNAGHKLAPLVSRTWFAQVLRPKLEMRTTIDEAEAIGDLAQRAVVTRDYAPQLRTLLEYMEFSGIVRREGTTIILNRNSGQPSDEKRSNDQREQSMPAATAKAQSTAPLSGLGSGRGGIQLSVNIEADMAEIATWRPERITAFFTGLAMVVAAKKGDGEPRQS